MSTEQELKHAIQQSINKNLSAQERRLWFQLVCALHKQRDQQIIKRMEARFK